MTKVRQLKDLGKKCSNAFSLNQFGQDFHFFFHFPFFRDFFFFFFIYIFEEKAPRHQKK